MPYRFTIEKNHFESAMHVSGKRNSDEPDTPEVVRSNLSSALDDFEEERIINYFLLVLFTDNVHEVPWKLVKCIEPSSKDKKWDQIEQTAPDSFGSLNENDRFNNCFYIFKDQVLVSALYNFFIYDT